MAMPQPASAQQPARCENCGSPAGWKRAFASTDEVDRCAACGGWTFSGQVSAPAEELYDEGYFSGGEYAAYDAARASHEKNFRRKLKLLQQHGAPPASLTRLLEIGCATGEFLAQAKLAGVGRALGLEVSDYCRKVARDRGHDVLSPTDPTSDDAVAALRPNVVVAWDVWEHLRSPASIFETTLQRCDDGVMVALTTVDASSAVARFRGTRWRQFHPPTHLHYPTRESFRVVGVRASRSPPPWMTTPVYLDLFDIQLVIARRTAR